jgi:hypothetical protein
MEIGSILRPFKITYSKSKFGSTRPSLILWRNLQRSRPILSVKYSRSDYFRAMLEGSFKEGQVEMSVKSEIPTYPWRRCRCVQDNYRMALHDGYSPVESIILEYLRIFRESLCRSGHVLDH